jgi:uncharacterized protein (DUF1501 family)
MLSILDSSVRLCDGVSRREILRAGGVGLLAAPALGVAPLLANEPGRKPKACIVLFLMGGVPQHSTWDPKPEAPAEVRGDYAPISTSASGVHISELMPLTAQWMDRIAVLRAVATDDNAHSSSGYAMLTGQAHIPKNRENANPGAPNNWPSLGAVMQHLSTGPRLLPPAVRLPQFISNTDGSIWPGQDSGWLGHTADPWLFQCEPASPNFDVPQFRLQADMSLGRMGQRRTLLDQLESQLREVDRNPAFAAYGGQQQQAFGLFSDAAARSACDVKLEPEATRARYGEGQFGQSCLLARRLVEAGVQFVQVNWFRPKDEPGENPVWDSHIDESQRLKNVLVPPFDQAYTALLRDLEERGLWDDTLVVVLSEFGRSPKINARGGRDHWGYVFSVALAGAGIRGGVAHGSSDAVGGFPRDGRVEPQDILATIFDRMGHSPETLIYDAFGRPLPISRGEVIRAIV